MLKAFIIFQSLKKLKPRGRGKLKQILAIFFLQWLKGKLSFVLLLRGGQIFGVELVQACILRNFGLCQKVNVLSEKSER